MRDEKWMGREGKEMIPGKCIGRGTKTHSLIERAGLGT